MELCQDLWCLLGENSDQLTAIGSIATAVVAGIIGFTLWILRKQSGHLEKQVLVSNFTSLTDYIGNEITRKNRQVLYRYYESPLLAELIEKYDDIDDKSDLKQINESFKQIGAMYERVGFLLQQDKDLEEKFIKHHGFSMGIMWRIFQKMNDVYKQKDKAKGYTDFEWVGEKSYKQWKKQIDEFLEVKKNQNSKREKFES